MSSLSHNVLNEDPFLWWTTAKHEIAEISIDETLLIYCTSEYIKARSLSMYWLTKQTLPYQGTDYHVKHCTPVWPRMSLLAWNIKVMSHMYTWTKQPAKYISTEKGKVHYDDVTTSLLASQITSLTTVYSTVYSGADQRKLQSSASLAILRGIHRDRWIPRTKGQ